MSELQCSCCGSCDEQYSEEILYPQLDEIIAENKEQEGCLIPILQKTQQLFGYLPEGALKKISAELMISYSEIAGVVGFYSFFSTVPRGKYLIRVCLGTACYVRGGKDVLEALKKELGIDVGETTEDRSFSLDVGRCFGACGLAPVIMINDEVYQNVKPSKLNSILSKYQPE